jgi:hypothetical protein
MKLLKNSFLGTVFLLAMSSTSFATSNNNLAKDLKVNCVPYTLSCGYGGLACGFDSTQGVISEVIYWENELC